MIIGAMGNRSTTDVSDLSISTPYRAPIIFQKKLCTFIHFKCSLIFFCAFFSCYSLSTFAVQKDALFIQLNVEESTLCTPKSIVHKWGGDKGGRNWAVTKNHEKSQRIIFLLCDSLRQVVIFCDFLRFFAIFCDTL